MNVNFDTRRDLVKRSKSYTSGDRFCMLCLDEKLCIKEKSKDIGLINKDHMWMRKCPDKINFMVSKWKEKVSKTEREEIDWLLTQLNRANFGKDIPKITIEQNCTPMTHH